MIIERTGVSVVIPIFNSLKTLSACIGSVIIAMENYGSAELILIDNGSADGSYEMLLSNYARVAKIEQIKGATISALRNCGARLAKGSYLCFIDSDCVIRRDYFHRAMEVFSSINPAATGCSYELPELPHWIEETWHRLHQHSEDGYVVYLNSGNFIVAKETFLKVGGFDETLMTGEDAELGQRLCNTGFQIYECHIVSAIHLGNPKSLRGFFQKQVWHGLGMFGTSRVSAFDKPVFMTFLHLSLNVLAILVLLLAPVSLRMRFVLFVVLSALAPAFAVLYRWIQQRSVIRPLRAITLYYLYFSARVWALIRIGMLRNQKTAQVSSGGAQ
jgi:glycosyltransferase involved in cell wall biosynthesis